MTVYNHVNFFSKIVNNKIICLDLGDKNIGVAISDQGLKFANPLINNVTGINIAPIKRLFVFVSMYK